MAFSPFEHSLLSGLFGDPELAGLFSEDAELEAMLRFEAALAGAQAEAGVIPAQAAEAIIACCQSFVADFEKLRSGVARDGVSVPALLSQMRAVLPQSAAPCLHFGATSQDAIDTGLVLRLATVADILETRIAAVIARLGTLESRFGARPMMGRTRMQDALEIDVAHRIADWRLPLARHLGRLSQLRPRLLVLQLGGPVGTAGALGPKASGIIAAVADRLGLGVAEKSWHNQRDGVIEFAGWLALVAGSLGKIGQDIAIMAQDARGEIVLAGGGGSSAMPHKANPVAAEILVALARFGAGLNGTIAQSMVHEQERSGAAWTLEWLVLPQIAAATGSALLLAGRLLASVESLGRPAIRP